MSTGGWIGVDLDGTLAEYDGWKGADHIGLPVPAMVVRVKQWLDEGREVRIFTARVYPDFDHQPPSEDALRARVAIVNWCEQHLGRALLITCMKGYDMIELWDDRAVQVEPNTGRRMDGLP